MIKKILDSFNSKSTAPFFIIHGEKDVIVDVSQSQLLHEALKKAGVEAKLHIVKDGGHGRIGKEYILPEIHAFFNKHLKNG